MKKIVHEIALQEGTTATGSSFIAAAVLLTTAFASVPAGFTRVPPPADMTDADTLESAFRLAGVSNVLRFPA